MSGGWPFLVIASHLRRVREQSAITSSSSFLLSLNGLIIILCIISVTIDVFKGDIYFIGLKWVRMQVCAAEIVLWQMGISYQKRAPATHLVYPPVVERCVPFSHCRHSQSLTFTIGKVSYFTRLYLISTHFSPCGYHTADKSVCKRLQFRTLSPFTCAR